MCLLPLCYGQDLVPLTLCKDKQVVVSPGSSGIIQHVTNSQSNADCTLTVSGFASGTYISLLGVSTVTQSTANNPIVRIQGTPYMSKGSQSEETIQLSDDAPKITFQTSANSGNFSIEYHNKG